MSDLRISILCDNKVHAPGLGSEWGLAMSLRLKDGSTWLWDAGQTDIFLDNAEKMDVDLSSLSGVAISHGHYDHAGGLDAFFQRTGFTGDVFAHPDWIRTRFNVSGNKPREIGIPCVIPEFIPVSKITKLADELTMISDIDRLPGNYQAVANFTYDSEGTIPDAVPDDAFLVADTEQGTVVILGCCHSGLANSLATMRTRMGITRIKALIGGLHLYNSGTAELNQAVAAMEEFEIEVLAAGHCTGDKALEQLKQRMKCEVVEMGSGLVLEF